MPVIKGKCKWACVQSPNTMYDPVWSIDIICDAAMVKELKKNNVKTKKNKDGDVIAKFKRNVTKASGEENTRPPVYGPGGKAAGDFTQLVGNGSVVRVQYGTYPWNNKFGTGIGVDLKGTQVIEHVPFEDADGESLDAVESDAFEEKPAAAPKKQEKVSDVPDEEFDDDIPF